MSNYVIWLDQLGINDINQVGGKNASLGEMITCLHKLGVSVPGGFATTANAFQEFLIANNLKRQIDDLLAALDVSDIQALTAAGKQIRAWIMQAPLGTELEAAIRSAFTQLEQQSGGSIAVAVRSSATAEDLPDASFAGQQETFLNVRGIDQVLSKIREVFASLYNDRAISYRVHQGFAHEDVSLSAGVQLMVRSDIGASGVLFTLDTESGFAEAVFITAAWGLGETVVQGAVNPDEFYVYKPAIKAGNCAVLRRNRGSKAIKMVYAADGGVETIAVDDSEQNIFCISDLEVEELARQALVIEKHYGRPMDIEWAKDGNSGKIYIVQARPETVNSQSGQTIERYKLLGSSEIVCDGRSIGQKIGTGKARVISSIDTMELVKPGDILVTDMTDPDWEPVMKIASAIVTNRGGRTCHAAIIAREMGVPAVVGCGNATSTISHGDEFTVSCAQGDTGYIYSGILDFEVQRHKLGDMPPAPLKITMNVGNPDRAFSFSQIPNAGVGLARLEFIINRMIGIHPRALLEYAEQSAAVKAEIDQRIGGYAGPVEYYVERLAEGISMIAAAFAPAPVIVRLSDFKSNEYANLIGGRHYEPEEENPMLGFRGASRYVSPEFQQCFELECQAMVKVREQMGLSNVWAMVPFVRTVDEAKDVIEVMRNFGLERGKHGLKIIMMCELPANALLADEFLEHFDGMSIGSNDMTQLTLGLDRDSGLIADLFDERNPAVKAMLSMAIKACRKQGKYIGICGQGPSDYPDLAEWLLAEGIESISLNPDTVIDTWLDLAGVKT